MKQQGVSSILAFWRERQESELPMNVFRFHHICINPRSPEVGPALFVPRESFKKDRARSKSVPQEEGEENDVFGDPAIDNYSAHSESDSESEASVEDHDLNASKVIPPVDNLVIDPALQESSNTPTGSHVTTVSHLHIVSGSKGKENVDIRQTISPNSPERNGLLLKVTSPTKSGWPPVATIPILLSQNPNISTKSPSQSLLGVDPEKIIANVPTTPINNGGPSTTLIGKSTKKRGSGESVMDQGESDSLGRGMRQKKPRIQMDAASEDSLVEVTRKSKKRR